MLTVKRSPNQFYSIFAFALLIGWVISFPYEGPVFYSLIAQSGRGDDLSYINSYSLFALAAGLLVPVFLAVPKNIVLRILTGVYSSILALFLPLALIPELFWPVLIPLTAFLAGSALSLNGCQIILFYPKSMWGAVAPDAMLIACAVVISAHILVAATCFMAGFVFIGCVLIAAIFCLTRLDADKSVQQKTGQGPYPPIFKTFWRLFLFIFLITINAGIMFQVIYPAFAHHGLLVPIFTNIPYVAAIIVLSKFHKGNKFNMLYLGLALWGTALLLFNKVDLSLVASFLLISTCMLFAAGIFDLFWWIISITSFSYIKNPATMIGAVFSVNILGSWFGGLISNFMLRSGINVDFIVIVGILSIFLCMVLIVPLNKQIASQIETNEFIEPPRLNVVDSTDPAVRDALSSREVDVFDLLCQGLSDKEISGKLHISIHTVKSHNRKIYSKLEIKNRTELRRLFGQPDG